MNPDVFITIVFCSFGVLVGVAGALVATVTALRGRRRADESPSPPLEGAKARSPQPVAAPTRRPLHSEHPSLGRPRS
jgi:heme/copper-type cytochrome/quinol oxidase subunit 2